MATTAYDIVEVELLDGTKLSLRPASIKTLRKFMQQFQEFGEIEEEEEGMTALVKMAGLLIEKQVPEIASDQDKLEDVLDIQTIYKIIEVCGGIKLNDPKLLEQAMRMTAEGAGTN